MEKQIQPPQVEGQFWLVVRTTLKHRADGSPVLHPKAQQPLLDWPPRVVQADYGKAVAVAKQLAQSTPGVKYVVMEAIWSLCTDPRTGCTIGKSPAEDLL